MKTIEISNVYEEIINKSKFYGIVFHIESIDEFKDKLKDIKKEYPKATHYCYAYRVNNITKSSDDGEPSGTAGIQILNSILNNEIENVGIVVVRYFGGILLGAGGLTRAYRESSNKAIKNAKIVEYLDTNSYSLEYEYSINSAVVKYLDSKNIKVLDTKYELQIIKTIATNESLDDLFDLCNGNIKITKLNNIQIKGEN